MERKKLFLALLCTICLCLILVNCSDSDILSEQTELSELSELSEPIEPPSTVKMTVPYNPLDPYDRPGRESLRVVHTVWFKPENDPRQVIGYQIEDGTQFFDHVVMMNGLQLRAGDCSDVTYGRCKKDYLHACTGEYYMNHYITNGETYFKPIRDTGIKILLQIQPMRDGVGIGNLFTSSSWTAEDTANYGFAYPFGPPETYRMIDEIAQLMVDIQIDGIAFDDSNIGTWLPPAGGGRRSFAVNNANIIRFCYELQAALDLKGYGRKAIFENYEYNSIPVSATFVNRQGVEVTVQRNDYLTYAFSQSYGGWNENPSSPGFPYDRYGPASVAIADPTGPRPPYGQSGVIERMGRVLYNPNGYGLVMYYCHRSRKDLLDTHPTGAYGAGNDGKPEAYFSQISNTLHGMPTIFVGVDYPRIRN